MESPVGRHSSCAIEPPSARDHVTVGSTGRDPRVHILLIDDNRDLREYVTRLLGRWWDIEAAGDAVAALGAVRRRRPTLILADAGMAGVGGARLPQTLRDDPTTRSIPLIIVFDGGAENPDASDGLVKPFSSRELVERVSSRLDEQLGTSLWLLNSIALPMAVLRRDGLIVEHANRAYLDSVGDRDVIGRCFGEPLVTWAGNPLTEPAGPSAPDARHGAYDLTVPLHCDGAPDDKKWSFLLAPVTDRVQGRDRHVMAIGVEVTDELRARRHGEALAAEAIRANLAKDRFLAALGHELRNPLSAILACLQIMRPKGVCSRELDVVERQVGTIVRLVDDLLDVSRIGRSQIALHTDRIEIADVVAYAIETVTPLLTERRQRLTVAVPASGLRVQVDAARMAQVISNLLTNAAKYSEVASTIAVRAVRDDRHVRLSVEDHGIGITPDMLPHVFEAFAQAPHVRSRCRGGLGLGLAIVRHLVELHGGTITAHSGGPDAGSTFCVALPADDGDLAHDDTQSLEGAQR